MNAVLFAMATGVTVLVAVLVAVLVSPVFFSAAAVFALASIDASIGQTR